MGSNVLRRTGALWCRHLILASVVLLAMPVMAREVAIAPVVEGAAVLSQYAESGASDGSDYLFVWLDERTGGFERRATRVSRDGVVLDRDGIRLPFVSDRNSVVWTGTSYLIVWGESYPFTIRTLRIDRDGRVIDGPRVVKQDAFPMSVISNGNHVVISYHTPQESAAGFGKRALFLDADGEIDADVFLDDASNRGAANLAWNGSHFAAVWVDDANPEDPRYAIEGVRFDHTGLLDAAPRRFFEDASSTWVATPSIASDGQNFVMVTRAGDDRHVAHRISGDLSIFGLAQPLPALEYELMPHRNLSSSILWNGSNYLILGHDGHAITGVRIDREGRPVGTDVIERTAGIGVLANPVAATNGRDLLVAWTGRFSADPEIGTDVFGTVVSASTLDPRSRTLLSVGPQHQRRPLVASGGANLLAVWQEGAGIYAHRLTTDGVPLDAVPLRLAERGTPTAVVFNGRDYIVVWPQTTNRQTTGVITARVPRDGALRVEGGATLPDAIPVGAASDGVTTLLLWRTADALQLSRINADGSIAGAAPITAPEDAWIDGAVISAGNGAFLVAWEEMRMVDGYACPPISASTVHGARVAADLVSLDPVGFPIAAGGVDDRWPAISWNGRDWLVVWSSLAGSWEASYQWELRGRTVTSDGNAQGSVEGAFIAPGALMPAVAWDGGRYLLAWYDEHVSTLRAAYLTTLGQSISSETRIEDTVFDWNPVSVMALRHGAAGVTYVRKSAEAPYGEVSRAFLNVVSTQVRRRSAR